MTGDAARADEVEPQPSTGWGLWRMKLETASLASLALASALTLAFVRVADEVSEGETRFLDETILTMRRRTGAADRPIGPYWLETAMIDVTSLGGYTLLTLITCLVAVYLVMSRRYRDAGLVVAAVAGGSLLSNLLKIGFARSRPELVDNLVSVSSFSFPSGHALLSATTCSCGMGSSRALFALLASRSMTPWHCPNNSSSEHQRQDRQLGSSGRSLKAMCASAVRRTHPTIQCQRREQSLAKSRRRGLPDWVRSSLEPSPLRPQPSASRLTRPRYRAYLRSHCDGQSSEEI